MKKLLSLSLAIIMLISVVALTACSNGTLGSLTIEEMTKPGMSYDLQQAISELDLDDMTDDQRATAINNHITRFVRVGTYSYGEGQTYIMKLKDYGYTDVGFTIQVVNKYKYPVKFENVQLTFQVLFTYDYMLSSGTSASIINEEPIIITLDLDENGYGIISYAEPISKDIIDHNVYCKYGFNSQCVQIKIINATGTVTYLPRAETAATQAPTEEATPTPAE